MFFRIKQSQGRQYLQIVENFRDQGRVKQRVLATLGRLDDLQHSGRLDGLLASGARFAEQLDFKLERARWRKVDPPVELHPNSRFGIGVLSYFMLADEIQVTAGA